MGKKGKLPVLSKQDPLVPIDVTNLGSKQDPCFGQAYDLSTKECKLCGDSELCCIKMAQTLNVTRKEIVEKASIKFEVPKKDIRLIYKSM